MLQLPIYKFITSIPSNEYMIERWFYCAKFNHYDEQTLVMMRVGPYYFEIAKGDGSTIISSLDIPLYDDTGKCLYNAFHDPIAYRICMMNDYAEKYLLDMYGSFSSCIDELKPYGFRNEDCERYNYFDEEPPTESGITMTIDTSTNMVVVQKLLPFYEWKVDSHLGEVHLVGSNKGNSTLYKMFEHLKNPNPENSNSDNPSTKVTVHKIKVVRSTF